MIVIKPHTGIDRRGNEVVFDQLDAIWLTEGGKVKRIGYIGKGEDAPIQLIEPGISPAVIAEIKRIRFGEYLGNQEVQEPRPLSESEFYEPED